MNCPYCRTGFSAGELAPWSCADCGTPVHAECAASHGGCVTYGCAAVELAPAPLEAERATLTPRLPATVHARAAFAEAVEFTSAALSPWSLLAFALLGAGALALQL